jgi:hypothetical protein
VNAADDGLLALIGLKVDAVGSEEAQASLVEER